MEDAQLNDITIDIIREHVRHLLIVMGLADITVECGMAEDVLRITIDIKESGSTLIGVQGMHLNALQHIIRCITHKQTQQHIHVIVDVNGYRARRERSLLGLAQEVARKAQKTGKSVELKPMSAMDRRTIHTALASHKDIQTESRGDEPGRCVVVRPIFF